ncbi:LOW QUALITY PROTEIN: hypothetical protein MAR_023291 [Mya arenaria]|uniref:C2H2-type domain-containing protein n=1 Tax=Mya arenaria TaxID=6604 RepID=A0ABY7DPW5_MYAAR|nr:LOW QUALITY PROTEIN: hypothetical protein MAR_023291 [Mya arenaria]
MSCQERFNGIIYEGPEGGVPIYLYYHDEHFDVITKMTGFLNRKRRVCNNPCVYCHQLHTDETEYWRFCDKCNRYFKNGICFQMHLKKSSEDVKNTCEIYFKCKDCDQTINLKRHKKAHVCHEKTTNVTCSQLREKRKLTKQPARMNDDRLECDQGFVEGKTNKCNNCRKSWCGSNENRPNLCVAHRVCDVCLHSPVTSESSCKTCGKNERIFQGLETTEGFCKWLFSEENVGATVICHIFKGYDSYPILQYLHNNSILPDVITTGSKYMSVKVSLCNIRMIDSLNCIPMPLADMPVFLAILSKQKVTFLICSIENQSAILPHLPDLQFYAPDSMKPEARRTFLQWHEINKTKPFDLQK